MQTLIKRPGEVRTYTWDFTLQTEIVALDTLSGTPVCTATLVGTAVGAGTVPVIGSPSIVTGSKKVTAQVSGGIHGNKYRMECVCSTAAGSTLVCEGILEVSNTTAPPGG